MRGTNILAPTAPLYYPHRHGEGEVIQDLQITVFYSKTHALKGGFYYIWLAKIKTLFAGGALARDP